MSKPLTGLRGTHVAGGSVVWIVGDLEYFTAKGFQPLGMEPLAVGVTSDADHIITPSKEGPITVAIREALGRGRGARPRTWGAGTCTPPPPRATTWRWRRCARVLPETVLVTARKGTFGHGMGAGGGWELTAQYLGYARGKVFPTPLTEAELNPEIGRVHEPLRLRPGLRRARRARRQALHGRGRHQRLRHLAPLGREVGPRPPRLLRAGAGGIPAAAAARSRASPRRAPEERVYPGA